MNSLLFKKLPLYFIMCLLASYFIFLFWGIMLAVWFGALILIQFKGYDLELNRKERLLFDINAHLYPLLGTLIKVMIVENIIPDSWFWLNRLEHYIWAVAIGILFFPLLKDSFAKLHLMSKFILFVGLVVILGNLNEFMEYGLRIYMNLTTQYLFSEYYKDTIIDLVTNVLGAVTGFVIVYVANREQ